MQGTIVKVTVEEGATVAEGDVIVVLEAMKMEQPIKAHKAGTVTGLKAEVGSGVTNGEVICEIKDAGVSAARLSAPGQWSPQARRDSAPWPDRLPVGIVEHAAPLGWLAKDRHSVAPSRPSTAPGVVEPPAPTRSPAERSAVVAPVRSRPPRRTRCPPGRGRAA